MSNVAAVKVTGLPPSLSKNIAWVLRPLLWPMITSATGTS